MSTPAIYLTPVAGKNHSFICNGNYLPVRAFEAPIEAPFIDVSNFNQFPQDDTGFERIAFTFKGHTNAAGGGNWSQSPSLIRVGQLITVVAAFNSVLKISISVKVGRVRYAGDVATSSEFEAMGQFQGIQQPNPGTPLPITVYPGDT